MNAPSKDPPPSPMLPPKGTIWAPGAEPMAICMSCNSTFPPHFAECTNCQVALSVVRKCPACGKIQSAHHVTCIYCADSFLREEGLTPAGPGPLARRSNRAEQRLRRLVYTALAVILLGGGALVLRQVLSEEATEEYGRSYALGPVSMRRKAAADAPPVKDLQASEQVSITGYTHDMLGNRWFRVQSASINGFLRAEEVAPPKSTVPEKGYEILRHSLMALDDPKVLTLAHQAVDLYHATFPSSTHYEELRWLLAERSREMSEAGRSPEMMGEARTIYEEISKGKGEFSDRAKETLSQLPAPHSSAGGKGAGRAQTGSEWKQERVPTTSTMGGRFNPSAPIRRVIVVSRMPLFVRLTQAASIGPGAILQGEFAQDVRVSQELAVPRGSAAVVMVAQEGAAKRVEDLLLTGATIRGESYIVSAYSRGLDIPGGGKFASTRTLPTALPAGTTIEFRLLSDLVVRQR